MAGECARRQLEAAGPVGFSFGLRSAYLGCHGDTQPFNLTAWIEENRDLLKPPVGNKNLYVDSGDYIVMIVAGPNARKDYHYNETEELFYQLEGQITVRIQEDGQAVDMKLGPGDMYLHPAGVPHSPMREAGSLGLVIERKRKARLKDGLMWFATSATTSCTTRTSNSPTSRRTSCLASESSTAARTCAPAIRAAT